MSRSTSGSTSSGLAKGKKFIKKLLYVQYVDKEKDMACEIPEPFFQEYLQYGHKMFSDLRVPNFDFLKSSLKDDSIEEVTVYSNPLPFPLEPNVAIHAFVILKTENRQNFKETWWSLEKNGKYIVLQQSSNKDDVIKKIYDAEKKESVKRLEPVRPLDSISGNYRPFKDLLRAICDTDQLKRRYHLLFSNCQNFASFVFAKSNKSGMIWSAPTSTIFISKNKKIQPGIEADTVKYNSIVNDEKFELYRAIIEGECEDFEELINISTIESLNSVDSQGYTLLEWGTAFSSFNWPIDEELKKKGVTIPSDEGLNIFRRNVFFIGLQYLPPNKAVNSKLIQKFVFRLDRYSCR
jgi:hypothetical protein